jgi:hypothetical protein
MKINNDIINLEAQSRNHETTTQKALTSAGALEGNRKDGASDLLHGSYL